MASVFLSHSSRDRQATRQVSDVLRAAGFGALFVDFDPDLGIPAGRNWEHWARELPVGALGGIPGPEATRPSSVLADAAE